MACVCYLGDYFYLWNQKTLEGHVISPLLTGNSGVKCIRFWYYLSNIKKYGSEIGLYVNKSGQKTLLWNSASEKKAWQYIQIPLTYNEEFTVGK